MLNTMVLGVIGLNIMALAFVIGRGPLFHTRIYKPMLKNIVLSIAPVLVFPVWLFVLAYAAGTDTSWLDLWGSIVLFLIWLVLLPNAGYLITELNMSHRREGETVPIWYDVVMIITLAMSGVVNTVMNVFGFQLIYSVIRFGDTASALRATGSRLLVVAILVLVAFGIYIGRSRLRLNSWDVLRPWRLVSRVLGHLRTHLGEAIGFTLTYALFLGLMYLVIIGPVLDGLELADEIRGVI